MWSTADNKDQNGNAFQEGDIWFDNALNVVKQMKNGAARVVITGNGSTPRKTGTITIAAADAAGDVSLTGFGFVPTLVFFIGSTDAAPGQASDGWSDGTIHACTLSKGAANGSNLAKCFDIGDGTDDWSGIIKSFDNAGGFTYTTTKQGAGKNVTIKYLAIV